VDYQLSADDPAEVIPDDHVMVSEQENIPTKTDIVIPWLPLARKVKKVCKGIITKAQLTTIIVNQKLPKAYADVIYFCTRTFQKIIGSRSKHVKASRVYEMLRAYHRVLFSGNIYRDIKRGYGRRIRAEIRRFIEKHRPKRRHY
jgi:hypothetical protein